MSNKKIPGSGQEDKKTEKIDPSRSDAKTGRMFDDIPPPDDSDFGAYTESEPFEDEALDTPKKKVVEPIINGINASKKLVSKTSALDGDDGLDTEMDDGEELDDSDSSEDIELEVAEGHERGRVFIRAFIAALRNAEFFRFFEESLSVCDRHMTGLVRGGLHPNAKGKDGEFLENVSTPRTLSFFRFVQACYHGIEDKPVAPLVFNPVEHRQFRSQKDFEKEVLTNFFRSKTGRLNEEILEFIQEVLSRDPELAEDDFLNCRRQFYLMASEIAGSAWKSELDPKSPFSGSLARQERIAEVDGLFSRARARVIRGSSPLLMRRLRTAELHKRVPFHCYDHKYSMDNALFGGFPARGLTVFMGQSSGGKTLIMSSILANHLRKAASHLFVGHTDKSIEDDFMQRLSEQRNIKLEGLPNPNRPEEMKSYFSAKDSNVRPPRAWVISTEGNMEEYYKRSMCNLMNIDERTYNHLMQTTDLSNAELKIAARIVELQNSLYEHVLYFELPKRNGIPDLRVNSIINLFREQLASGEPRPDFIIIDYLLHLTPANERISNQAEAMKEVARVLEGWSTENVIPIITAVQLNREGRAEVGRLSFADETHVSEATAIFNSSSLFFSFIPIEVTDMVENTNELISLSKEYGSAPAEDDSNAQRNGKKTPALPLKEVGFDKMISKASPILDTTKPEIPKLDKDEEAEAAKYNLIDRVHASSQSKDQKVDEAQGKLSLHGRQHFRMALKVIKNRGGKKDLIILSDLDYSKQRSLFNTQVLSEKQWHQFASAVREMRRLSHLNALASNDDDSKGRTSTTNRLEGTTLGRLGEFGKKLVGGKTGGKNSESAENQSAEVNTRNQDTETASGAQEDSMNQSQDSNQKAAHNTTSTGGFKSSAKNAATIKEATVNIASMPERDPFLLLPANKPEEQKAPDPNLPVSALNKKI
jgi:hypothetical protein